jgi:cysteinyl-tRNA synthetase
MIMAEGTGPTEEITSIVKECKMDFDAALDSDFNTSLATNAFFKLIKGINRIAASEAMTKSITEIALPGFERMLDILGLQVQKITESEKQTINELLKKRELLRSQKQYSEADRIRDQISSQNIVLLDHKNKTVWMKKEKIKSDA